MARTPIFLGMDQKNYWVQIVGVTLKHEFEQTGLPGERRQGSPPVPRVPAFLEWCICPTGASTSHGEAGHQPPPARNLVKTHHVE